MSNRDNFTLMKVWKTTTLALAGLMLVMVTLAGCTAQAGANQSAATGPVESGDQAVGEDGLAGTSWRLLSYGMPGAETPVIEGSTITLEFDSEGRAGGTGGCNSYGAHYEVQDKALSFGEISRTMMACTQEDIGKQEQNYFLALETASNFVLDEGRLRIWYESGQGVLNWVKSG